jgi:hypothetical protein
MRYSQISANMTIERLLVLYEEGMLTEGELFPTLGENAAPDRIEALMAQVPEPLRQAFCDWAFTVPDADGLFLGAEVGAQEAARRAARQAEGARVVRHWIQGRNGGAAWDHQIEADIRAGRLDEAGRRADADFEAGRCKPL